MSHTHPTQQPPKRWKKARWLLLPLALFLLLLLVIWIGIWSAPRHTTPPIITLQTTSPTAPTPNKVRILTLNVAHGRQNALHQVFLGKRTIRNNLRQIVRVLKREDADIVALQEADGPSWWSGNFHHIHSIAKQANYPYVVFGPLINLTGLQYGAAILSRRPLKQAESVRFKHGFPMFGKGFVVASFQMKGRHKGPIDILSLHLDPPRASMREKQLQELKEYLTKRGKPTIIVGDFNTEWTQGNNQLKRFAHAMKLRSYQPTHPKLKSFPFLNRRLDWILIPPPFQFQQYKHLSDPISDHLAVVTNITLPPTKAQQNTQTPNK